MRPTTDEERAPLVEYLRGRATITMDALPEDLDPEDSFGSELEENKQAIAKIREDYANGNEWAWTCVRVRAEFLGHMSENYLGACSYKSRADFKDTSGYYEDMVNVALDALAESILTDDGAYDDVTALADYFAGRKETAKPDAPLIVQWREFLAADPTEHSDDLIYKMVCDAMSCNWEGGPVEALVPGVADEFCAVSERLGQLYDTDREKWQRVYDATRPLFKAGCDFGEALEALQEAREVLDVDAERNAMAKARGIWAVMETYAQDEREGTTTPDASHASTTLRRVRKCLEGMGLPDARVSSTLQVMDETPTLDAQTVVIDADDRVELYHMLRGRGGSALKTKLLCALTILDPRHAAELED